MKDLLEKAESYGLMGFNEGLKLAPAANAEFMKIVPNCSFDDDNGVKLRVKMYKSYIKGYMNAMLSER